MLAEQEQIPPHGGPFPGPFAPLHEHIRIARLDAIIPQAHDLGRASAQLSRAECRQLRRSRGGAVFPVHARIAPAHGNARPKAALDVAKEILGTAGNDARKKVAAGEFLEVGHHRLFHRSVVLPVRPV